MIRIRVYPQNTGRGLGFGNGLGNGNGYGPGARIRRARRHQRQMFQLQRQLLRAQAMNAMRQSVSPWAMQRPMMGAPIGGAFAGAYMRPTVPFLPTQMPMMGGWQQPFAMPQLSTNSSWSYNGGFFGF